MLSPYKQHITTETTRQLVAYDRGEMEALSPAAVEVLDAMTAPQGIHRDPCEVRLGRMAEILISSYRPDAPKNIAFAA